MGSALLLGSGLVSAQIHLDGSAATANAPTPIRLAAESISTAEGNRTTRGTTVLGYNVNVGSGAAIAVSARAAIPAGYFVRVKLGGAVFRAAPTLTGGGTIAEGGVMSDQAVFPVPDAGIALGATVSVDIAETLAVSSASPGAVTASIEAYADQFDAINGEGALSPRFFGGSATIIQKVSGVTARVRAGNTAVADAATGFLWFVNPADDSPNTASATLGSFTVTENTTGEAATINASTGSVLVAGSLIPAAAGVHLRVEGELGIGAFELTRDDPATTEMVENNCPKPEAGSAAAPLMGNVRGTMEMPNTATISTGEGDDATNSVFGSGGSQGIYTLCVTVDTMGPMSNMAALPETEIMGTILLPNAIPAIAPRELASGVLGRIERNGASSQVSFLTTAEKYNQRLIVVNHNQSRDIAITDIQVNVQDDVEDFEIMGDPAELVIGPGEMKVYLVRDVLQIMGRNRASGTLSFNGVAGDISVATTIVNREDGSTDTVMWPVD